MKTEFETPGLTNLDFVESLYASYRKNPQAIPEDWRAYFKEMDASQAAPTEFQQGPSFSRASIFHTRPGEGEASLSADQMMVLQHRVERLIRGYRARGHIQAQIDPLNRPRPYVPELDLQYYELSDADLDREFVCETLRRDGRLPLREIISRLKDIYCGSIGFQYMHIDDNRMRHWVQERIESTTYWQPLPREQQIRIFTRLTDAVAFETFVRRKFLGAKSFSLEGGESLIPLLDLAIDRATQLGVREIVVGMAHRGRLNVLANIIGKSPRQIFREFQDADPDLYIGGGDVKYHMGYSSDYRTASGKLVQLSLCFNPSHLEFVNPVVMGRVRAKQDRANDAAQNKIMSLMIHGDAAFVGEGVVQETLNLSRLPGYRVGGTVHILVNNQIGFTTPPGEGRSTMYATSPAKMLPAPIMHVNGEDPEAVARCVQLALDFRNEFKQDVFIDMYCYRRLGHNESDEPSFTQPRLYEMIEQRKSVRDSYLDYLLKLGGLTREEAEKIERKRTEMLERHLNEARGTYKVTLPRWLEGNWKDYFGGPEPRDSDPETGVNQEDLAKYLERLTQTPPGFNLHRKLNRLMENRLAMSRGELPLDWSAGEALALATLAAEGYRVRLSGQDSGRGTFSHRHAILHDVLSGVTYVPLQNVAAKQAPVEILNSPLSEAGVLGFEYGYSLNCPDGLLLWEAQFGDFANAAQVVIDQFIASGEDKWRRLSGLVLLLPHGFEGAGPEHSSARIERFLTLAGEDNIQVAVPTTPAQFFHLLRRQVERKWRKPLIVMTPKSMLRHPQAVSPLAAFTQGAFQRLVPDPRGVPMDSVSRVLLCCGKLYYDLEARRQQLGVEDVAIVRLEQLYPFPWKQIEALLEDCRPGTNVIWVQEEPENMGAWRFLRVTVSMQFLGRLPFSGICRPVSASPATGSAAAHHLETEELLARVFAEEQPVVRPRTETIAGTKQMTVNA